MPAYRVFRYLQHPLFGRGVRITDLWPCYEDHYGLEGVQVIDYVDKQSGLSVLTVFIPHEPEGSRYIDEWVRVRNMDWLKRAAKVKAIAANKTNEVVDEAFAAKHPALYAFMTSTTEDEQPRELCKVQVFADSGVWKAAIHDANTEHSLFVTLGSPQDVWKALEKALTADQPDWRQWAGKAKKKRS